MERRDLVAAFAAASLPSVYRLVGLDPIRALPLAIAALVLALPEREVSLPDSLLLISLLTPISIFLRMDAKWRPPLEILPLYAAQIPALLAPIALGYFLTGWRTKGAYAGRFLSSFSSGFLLMGFLYLLSLRAGLHYWFSLIFALAIASALLIALRLGWRPGRLRFHLDLPVRLAVSSYILSVAIQMGSIPALHGDMWTYHARAFRALDSWDSFLAHRLILAYPPMHTLNIAAEYMLGVLPIFNSSILFLSLGPVLLILAVASFYSKLTVRFRESTLAFVLGGGLGGVLYLFAHVGAPTYGEELLYAASAVSDLTGDMLRGAIQSKVITPVASSLGLGLFLSFLALRSEVEAGLALASSFLTHLIEPLFLAPLAIIGREFGVLRTGLRRVLVGVAVTLVWMLLDGGYILYYLDFKMGEAIYRLSSPWILLAVPVPFLLLASGRVRRILEGRLMPLAGLILFITSFAMWSLKPEPLPGIEIMGGRSIKYIAPQFFLLLLIPSIVPLRESTGGSSLKGTAGYLWTITFTYVGAGMVFWGERMLDFVQLGLAPLLVDSMAKKRILRILVLVLVSQSLLGLYTARMAEGTIPLYNSSYSEIRTFEWLERQEVSNLLLTDGYTAMFNSLLYDGRVAPLFGSTVSPDYPVSPNPQTYRFLSLTLVSGMMEYGREDFTWYALSRLNVSHIYINRKNLEIHQRASSTLLVPKWNPEAFLLNHLSSIAERVWVDDESEVWILKEVKEVDIPGNAVGDYLRIRGAVRGFVKALVYGKEVNLTVSGPVELVGDMVIRPNGETVAVIPVNATLRYGDVEITPVGSNTSIRMRTVSSGNLTLKYEDQGYVRRFSARDDAADSLMVVIYRLEPFRTKVWVHNGTALNFTVDLRILNASGDMRYLRSWSHRDFGNWSKVWIQVKGLRGDKTVDEVSVEVRREEVGSKRVLAVRNATLYFEYACGNVVSFVPLDIRREGEEYLYASMYYLCDCSGEAEVTYPWGPMVLEVRCSAPRS